MGIEIELKVRQSRPLLDLSEAVQDKLATVYEISEKPAMFVTEDIYLYPPKEHEAMLPVRLRKDRRSSLSENKRSSKAFITVKIKKIVNGIEQNIEDEREISEKEIQKLVEIYVQQGYMDIGYLKVKSGIYYTFTNGITLNIEAVFAVKDSFPILVGNFYEIEKVLPDNASPQDIQDAKILLENTLRFLGIEVSEIEHRSWKLLCAEALNKEKESMNE